jgi:pimeloyl-ACP methyl ester carboxylesterase
MTLDGVVDEPTWSFDYEFTRGMEEGLGAVTDRSDGILLGRTTYEMFEPAWSTRTAEDDPGAPFFNDTMKYVVSSTLTEPTWRNSKILGAYDPDAIRTALARLTVPVLVLAGEVDGGPRPGLARRTAEVFPAAELAVQPGAGHYPWLDDPEWFVRRVARFLHERD